MPIRIPERPPYKKEHRTVGFMALAAYILLLAGRWLLPRLAFAKAVWISAPLAALAAFLLPALCYILYRGRGYTATLRLQAPRATHTPLLIAAFFALISGCLLLSLLTGGTDTLGNSVAAFEAPPFETVWETLLSVATAAILPAVVEEFFFRGIIAVEYERRGAFRAILMSTLLFALIRFDISNLPAYLFAGALLALVLYATNSLVATVILHVFYNVTSLLGQRYLNALYRFTGTVQLFLFILILVLLISLILFCRTALRIYRMRDEQGIGDPRRDVPYNVQFYTVLDALSDPAVILCFGIAIAGFILL